jgi:hypothetical protein
MVVAVLAVAVTADVVSMTLDKSINVMITTDPHTRMRNEDGPSDTKSPSQFESNKMSVSG